MQHAFAGSSCYFILKSEVLELSLFRVLMLL